MSGKMRAIAGKAYFTAMRSLFACTGRKFFKVSIRAQTKSEDENETQWIRSSIGPYVPYVVGSWVVCTPNSRSSSCLHGTRRLAVERRDAKQPRDADSTCTPCAALNLLYSSPSEIHVHFPRAFWMLSDQ